MGDAWKMLSQTPESEHKCQVCGQDTALYPYEGDPGASVLECVDMACGWEGEKCGDQEVENG